MHGNNNGGDAVKPKLPPLPTKANQDAFEQQRAVGLTREDFTTDYLGPVKSQWNRTAA